MSLPSLYADGKQIRLGARIGKGGEGEVYSLAEDPALAVKYYTAGDVGAREAKVLAMVASKLSALTPLVAFPISVAQTRSGRFAGFVMRLVSNHKPLHELYSPGPRKLHFPQADYRFLVHTAANISRAIAAVHRAGCVVGDINHSGILVSPKATVALIDADSFQFTSGTRTFPCVVGVPEYTPPELQGRSLAGITRTPNHDAFGLAVVLFQLLFMGRHPFVGTVRRGDIPPTHEAIRDFRYAYSDLRDVGMDQPPGTPAIELFDGSLAAAFERAFGRGTADTRPTAEEWVTTLTALSGKLERCAANPLHYAPRDAPECAWCEMERVLHTVLFLPYVPASTAPAPGFDPTAHGFRLEIVWAAIEAVPTPKTVPPLQTTGTVAPSTEARAAAQRPLGPIIMRAVVVIIVLVLLAIAPKLFWLWMAAGFLGWRNIELDSPGRLGRFEERYRAAYEAYDRALSQVEANAGLPDFARLKAELLAARDEYRNLAANERRRIEDYRTNRRQRQLHSFLDSFDIRHATIKGIGPARKVVLASYGIDTAADVERARVLAVPGFGATNSQGLFAWRAKIEARFRYSEQPTAADRQELARIRSEIESRAAALRKILVTGETRLRQLSGRASQVIAQADNTLRPLRDTLVQAEADLRHLGLTVPAMPSRSAPGRSSPHARPAPRTTAQPPAPAGTAPVNPTCPRCGSTMVRRLARRGRNAGGWFWGCSRYPTCKGTRNY
jgi:DNA-binding helix-hairpin-helix protein with protein kinase domain